MVEKISLSVETILRDAERGARTKADPALKALYVNIKKSPFVLWDDSSVADLAKCCILMLHYDLFDDETTEIAIAHLAYVYVSRAIDLENARLKKGETNVDNFIRIIKERVLLFELFAEYFRHSVAVFYQRNPFKVTPEELQKSLQITDLMLERFISYDLHICDLLTNSAVSTIEQSANDYVFSKIELQEIGFIHAKLFELIFAKIEDNDYVF